MNGAHLHLMLVHFPIAGVIGCALLLLASWFLRNDTVKLVGFALVLAVGLSAWAADETGELAARVVHNLPGVEGESIHIHAQAAQWALYSLGLNGLLAAYGLYTFRKNKRLPTWLFVTVTLLALHGSAVVARVGYLGGQIRHPETRPDFTAPAAAPSQPVSQR